MPISYGDEKNFVFILDNILKFSIFIYSFWDY